MPERYYRNPLEDYLAERKQPNDGYQDRIKRAQRLNSVAQVMNLVSQGATGAMGANITPMQDKVTPFALNEFSRLRQEDITRGDRDDALRLNALYKDLDYGVAKGNAEAQGKMKADELAQRQEQWEAKHNLDIAGHNLRAAATETPDQKYRRELDVINQREAAKARYQTEKKGTKEEDEYSKNSMGWILQNENRVDDVYSKIMETPELKSLVSDEELMIIRRLGQDGKKVPREIKAPIIRRAHHILYPELYDQPEEEVENKRFAPNIFAQRLGTLTTPPGWTPGMKLPSQGKQKQSFNPKDPKTAKVFNDAVSQANMILESSDSPEKKKAAFYDVFRNAGMPEENINNLWNKFK